MRVRTGSAMLVAVALVGLPACGGSKTPAAAPAAITIKSFKFQPNPLRVKVGQPISITNADGTNHTVTADDKSFDTGPFADGTKSITVSKAGRIAFHCNIHDFMKGVVEAS